MMFAHVQIYISRNRSKTKGTECTEETVVNVDEPRPRATVNCVLALFVCDTRMPTISKCR
jgi:hypothetical protein